MKSNALALALGALMVSVAMAQPHGHQHKHKRNPAIVWVTDFDVVTETAKLTTTVWVSPGFVPPTPAIPTPTPVSSSSSATSSTQSHPAQQFFQPIKIAVSTSTTSSSSSTSSTPTTSPTSSTSSSTSSTFSSVYVAPTPEAPPYVAPTPEVPPYVAPTPSSSHAAPTPTPEPQPQPTPTYAPVVQAPAAVATPSLQSATPVSTPKAADSYNSGGACSSGSPCTGDITYYEAGLGACGETTDGSVDKVIALPHEFMGTQSNGNPFCGKTVTITKGGKSVIAKVVDKCMGCTGKSIDLSNAAFIELAEFAVGRTTAEWWFN